MNQAAPKLPVSLAANPRLSSWVRFSGAGQLTLSPGKVEIGQGIVTALAQIAADELDVDIGRVKMVRASTAGSPNEGVTSGSLSIQQSGRAIRQACAEIRRIFLAAAADRLGVDANTLEINDGMISGPGNVQTSYWELADEISLDCDATLEAAPKSAAKRALAGQSVQRLDISDKVFARRRFIHDCAPAAMLHGRVLRPERSGATLTGFNEDGAHHAAAIYPPLYSARLDCAIMRHRAMERRSPSGLDPQPGGLSAPRRPCAGAQDSGREYHGRTYGRRRLLRTQCRRRCGARRS